MQIVRVAIGLIVQQSYGLGVEAVKESFGPNFGFPPNFLGLPPKT
jgi:hypothetical protein